MIQFSTDPGTDALLRGLEGGMRARTARQAVETDTALRRGIGAMLDGSPPPAAAPAPMMAPQAPQAAPPAAPQAQPAPPPQAPPQAAPAPAQSAPAAPVMAPPQPAPAPRQGGRYDPVLRELAQTPGGGAAALQVMQQQGREDIALGRRQDAMGRLVAGALARGDVATAQFYADRAGIPLPAIGPTPRRGQRGAEAAGGASGVNPRLLGIGMRLAEKHYGDNVEQGRAFMQAFVASKGDVQAAYDAASRVQGTGRIVSRERIFNDATQEYEYWGITRDGQGRPIFNEQTGQPLTGGRPPPQAAPRPPAGRVLQSDQGPVFFDFSSQRTTPVMAPDGVTPLQLPPRQQSGRTGAPQPGASGDGASLSPTVRNSILARVQREVAADRTIPDERKAAEIERRVAAAVQFAATGTMPPAPPPPPPEPERPGLFRRIFGGGTPAPAAPTPPPGRGGAGQPPAAQDAPPPATPAAPATPPGAIRIPPDRASQFREGDEVVQRGRAYRVERGMLIPVQ